MSNIEFHRLESFELSTNGRIHPKMLAIICSFETERFGYFQVKYKYGKLKELTNEPSLKMFAKSDRQYIRHICTIVYRMIYDAPAAKDRFRKS